MDDRVGFIQWIVGEDPGFICLASKSPSNNQWSETILRYPEDLSEIEQYIKSNSVTGNMYVCPTTLRNKSRIKENISYSYVAWADLDQCSPDFLRVKPSIVIETSPERYQAYWKLSHKAHAYDVEDINRRIAYTHEHQGCDISGWDLTQMLRVPNTHNFKYLPQDITVRVKEFDPSRIYDLEEISTAYPQIERYKEIVPGPFKIPDKLPEQTGEQLLEKWSTSAHPRVWRLFRQVPTGDWSSELWNLELTLFEIGVPREEVFVIARDSSCNKFKRDGYEDLVLWKEVLRAEAYVQSPIKVDFNKPAKTQDSVSDRELLTPEEFESARKDITVVDEYVEWATSVTDAPPQYHVAGGFIILTSILSGYLRLPTSFSTIIPNLWFMILADTTLTRKSTAMDLATDILDEISPDVMLATDGTVEGIMQDRKSVV